MKSEKQDDRQIHPEVNHFFCRLTFHASLFTFRVIPCASVAIYSFFTFYFLLLTNNLSVDPVDSVAIESSHASLLTSHP